MRPLKLTPLKTKLTPTEFAAYEAEQAGALPLLQQLSAAQPLGMDATKEEAWLRCIVSIATRHCNQGANWTELLTAGYRALSKCSIHYAKQPIEFNNWAAWWIRQGIVRTLPGNGGFGGIEADFLV